MPFIIEEDGKDVRISLAPWLWVVFFMGLGCGASALMAAVAYFGWFCS